MNLLTAIDFSEGTTAVLAETLTWSNRLKAHIWLVHVAEPIQDLVGYSSALGIYGSDPGFVANEADFKFVRDAAANDLRSRHAQLQEQAKKLREAGAEVTPLLLVGPVATTILKEAEKHQAGVIIVGSHGYGPVRQILTGSVSEGVLRHSTIPVLVVPTHKRG